MSSAVPPVRPVVVFDAFGHAVRRPFRRRPQRRERRARRRRGSRRSGAPSSSNTPGRSPLMGRYEPFWRLTERALDHALAAHSPRSIPPLREGVALPPTAASTPTAKSPAPSRGCGRGGAKTAILSNGDEAMLADAVAAAGIGGRAPTRCSRSTRVRVFKTDPRTYGLVEARFGCSRDDVLFVSSNPLGRRRRPPPSAFFHRLGEPHRRARRVPSTSPPGVVIGGPRRGCGERALAAPDRRSPDRRAVPRTTRKRSSCSRERYSRSAIEAGRAPAAKGACPCRSR